MSLAHTYSVALRCIGQALEKQNIELFDLNCEDDEFRLRCGDPVPPHLMLIELRYSSADIESLERAGQSRRGGSLKMVDFDGLPETLRAVGREVDEQGGRLVRICNTDLSSSESAIKLEYEDRAGDLKMEELSKKSIYEIMMQMYKERL